jgi:hypothetical protein
MRALVYLGQVNALRNLGRSLMSVLVMAIAAFMMTSSLSVGEGYTTQRAAEYRAFLGGDVLVYPSWTWPTETDLADLKTGAPGLSVLSPTFGSPLRYFHPNYYTSGYLTSDAGRPSPDYSFFSSRQERDEVLTAISGVPGVAGIYAFSSVPVVDGRIAATFSDGLKLISGNLPLSGFSVRACPPNLLADAGADTPPELRPALGTPDPPRTVTVNRGLGQTLAEFMTWETGVVPSGGRQLSAADGDALVAVVNRRAVIARRDLAAKTVSYPLDQRGQPVRLVLPTIVQGNPPDQTPYFDYGKTVTVEVLVVGTYDVLSRLYSRSQGPSATIYEQLFLEAPELLMPRAGFDRLLALMGLPAGEQPPTGALALRLENQAKAVEVVAALREAVPGLSVVSVADEATYANLRGQPERVYELTSAGSMETLRRRSGRLWVVPRSPFPPLGQPTVPAETGNLFAVLLFAFAGLVAAGNATLLVLSRRTEFAILKAIGLRGFEVGLTVMVEVVTLATVGLLVGFVAGELMALPIILTNNLDFPAVMRAIGQDLEVVALATLGCAIVFSLAPMAKTLSITVAEVMRANE